MSFELFESFPKKLIQESEWTQAPDKKRKNYRDATFINFPSFVTYIGSISYFHSKQLLVIYFWDCFCVYFYLFGRFKSLKGSSDWVQQVEQK